MYKTNENYVEEIINNINFILEHMGGVTKETLEADAVLTDSMLFRLIQISESSKNLSEEYKNKHEDIPWGDITALRNRLVMYMDCRFGSGGQLHKKTKTA